MFVHVFIYKDTYIIIHIICIGFNVDDIIQYHQINLPSKVKTVSRIMFSGEYIRMNIIWGLVGFSQGILPHIFPNIYPVDTISMANRSIFKYLKDRST